MRFFATAQNDRKLSRTEYFLVIELRNIYNPEGEATKNFGDTFSKYLNVQKNCGMSSDGDCWSTSNGGAYTRFDGSRYTNVNSNSRLYKIRLADGSSLSLKTSSDYSIRGNSEQLTYHFGDFLVDVNGDKQPNTLGKDVFGFYIIKFGIVPYGTPFETTYRLDKCRVDGFSCTAWVITKGNMDYLRKDVSW